MKKGHIHISRSVIILFISYITIFGLGYEYWINPFFISHRLPTRFYWISAGFMDDSIPILEQHHTQIDIVSPTWFVLEKNGCLTYNFEWSVASQTAIERIISICTAHDIPIHPLIAGGSVKAMQNLFGFAENHQRFFTNLSYFLIKYNATGVNIDFEGIPASCRNNFTRWFQILQENLTISFPDEMELSIDVPAITKDSTEDWGGWCDYRALGQIADKLMVMTYDAHGGWSEPGEVAPTSWVKQCLIYTIHTVPIEKIFMGIPQYGYDWSSDPDWENWGFGYEFFADRVEQYGGTPTRTEDGHELLFEYLDDNGYNHTAYYCDAETTWAKETFLSQYPIGGYCYWHLSSGDPAAWESS
jgi:spore germination protein YaaH